MCTYGTSTEKAERRRIRSSFPKYKIIDPGEYKGNIEKQIKGMQYCFELIDNCDQLVFSRLLKEITAGVGLEIKYALSKNIQVYELVGKRVKTIKKPMRHLSRLESIRLFRVWRRMNGS
jgi:hypothetical protein